MVTESPIKNWASIILIITFVFILAFILVGAFTLTSFSKPVNISSCIVFFFTTFFDNCFVVFTVGLIIITKKTYRIPIFVHIGTKSFRIRLKIGKEFLKFLLMSIIDFRIKFLNSFTIIWIHFIPMNRFSQQIKSDLHVFFSHFF